MKRNRHPADKNHANEKSRVKLDVMGAGRGASRMLPFIAEQNAASERFTIEPNYVDPAPGKARLLAHEAVAQGVQATYDEATFEDANEADEGNDDAFLILSPDRPRAFVAGLTVARDRERAVLGYSLLATPDGTLWGLRMVMTKEDRASKEEAIRFFEALTPVVPRSGSEHVFGVRGRPEHAASEPRFRAGFAAHLRANLPKVVAGLEPESPCFELSRDGMDGHAMIITTSPGGFVIPSELGRWVADHPSIALFAGEDFHVGEISPSEGVRLHTVRRRVSDGRVAVEGVVVPSEGSTLEFNATGCLVGGVAEALRRAERVTIRRTTPAVMTD